MSNPADTLFHSTTTVPLNAAGFVGRRTSSRVRKSACVVGCAGHTPFAVHVPTGAYAVATPSRNHSSSVNPEDSSPTQ